MGVETKSGFIGLATNTADLQAPPGALERARNVVIRRPGACEPRPGVYAPSGPLSNTQVINKLIPYESELITANASNEWWNVSGNVAIALGIPQPAPPALPTFRDDLIPHAQARGNLYVGTSKGVLKYDGATTGTSANPAFMLPWVPAFYNTIAAVTTTNPGWLPASEQVNYRVVFVRTDANGLTSRSAPTGAVTLQNSAGGSRNTQVTVSLDYPNCMHLYDTVELYRTRNFPWLPTSVTIDEEYQLVGSMAVTSGTLVFSDAMANSDRGATLYTSPSREGAEGSHGPVPAAGALAVFKEALFAGNLRKQAVKVVSFDAGDRTASATGIGSRQYTASTTNGSASISMATVVGLERGMLAYQPSVGWSDIANLPYITNIAGAGPYTVTLSAPATATAAPAVIFFDAIEVNGSWEIAMPAGVVGTAAGTSVSVTSPALIQRVTPPVSGYDNTLLLAGMFADQSLAIRATHGSEYNPPLPVYGATALTVAPESNPNMLVWSNPSEPEHFALKSFALVGDKKRAILGLVATRDAMYIFKEDGIWRLTGTNGQYRIDPFDLTTRCVLPSSIVPLKNRIFMLSNRGVVAVSDEGVEVVSLAIDDQLKKLVYDLDVAGAGSGYFISGVGYAGCASERDNEYMLLVASALSSQQSAITNGALVYNEVTRTWVSWEYGGTFSTSLSAQPRTWAARDRLGAIDVAQTTQFQQLLRIVPPGLAHPLGQAWGSDRVEALTVTAGGTNITFTPALSLSTAGGEYVQVGSFFSRITSVTDTTHVTVEPALPTGAGYAVRPITCTVRPRAFLAPSHVMKKWTQATCEFSRLLGVVQARFGARASVRPESTGVVNTDLDILKDANNLATYAMGCAPRGWLPTIAARGWRMVYEVVWFQVHSSSVLEAIFVEHEDGKPNSKNLQVTS